MEAIFASHQWLPLSHLDRDASTQFEVLQTAVRGLIDGTSTVTLCPITARLFNTWIPTVTRKDRVRLKDAYF